jgi:folate/biopterin transporter
LKTDEDIALDVEVIPTSDVAIDAKLAANSEADETSAMLSWLPTDMKESLFLGIEPTPEIVAIMTIYFVEGALGLARLAQTFLLKDEMHLGPAEMSALTGAFALPWTIKPLYGFLSDGFPLFGYRRRSYLIICGILGSASYLALGTDFGGVLADKWTLTATVTCLLLSSACIAFSDVVADGIVVQQTRDSKDPKVAGGLQSLCWGSASAGALLSSYFSGSLLEVMTPRHVFGLTAILPFLVTLIATSINESPVTKDANGNSDIGSVEQQMSDLWSAIKQPNIWKPALFIFLWQSTPTSDGAFLYFMTNDLGMGPEFLGRVRLVTAAASLLGVWGYQKYLRTVPIKDILFWSSIASFPLGMSSLLLISHANLALGIPDGAFVFGDDVALAILGEVAFLPTLVLAARICPPGVEAVLFATLMSIFNGASTVGTEVGALLTKWVGVTESNFDNLALLTIICNLTSLYPLLFIGWLDDVGDVSEEELEALE